MSQKVFRLHEGTQNSGWFESAPITPDELNTIKTTVKDAATSIPSPYAQIDLVKSAFAYLAQPNKDVDIHYNKNSEINRAHHKLVAEALDIAQLFFEVQKFEDTLKIIAYDPKNRITQLQHCDNQKHREFAETLNVFWNSDSSAFNFGKVERLYFILSKTNEIIGSTSPTTLFLASPEAERIMANMALLTCGKNTLFDGNFLSLDQRDEDFIIYFYTLSLQSNFASNFREVNEYIQKAKSYLSEDIKIKIAKIQQSDIKDYAPCNVLNTLGNQCEILGIPLGLNEITQPTDSDFVIRCNYSLKEHLPLVLPNYTFTENWIYTNGVQWNRNKKAPDKNVQEPENSILPEQRIPYNWLSADNFLEDKIIKLPYFIDKSKFQTCGLKEYLLPLTPLFFHFFKIDNVSNLLKLVNLAGGGIEARLTIPTKRGVITFKKTYNGDDIIKLDVHIAILPFLKCNDFNVDYTLGIQDSRMDKLSQLNVECFNAGNKVEVSSPTVRRPEERGSFIKSIYYKSKDFDCLRIKNEDIAGFIIPNLKECSLNQSVSFAIDFGTTNTHIEYKYGSNIEKALEITAIDPMWQSLLDINEQNKPEQIRTNDEFNREIIPYEIKDNSSIKFPFRTALAYNQDVNFNLPFEVFVDFNNYFLLEKVFYSRYMKVETRIKWGNYNSEEDRKLVESYIDYLLSITLYKTLLLNGDPQKTKITWFYPVSMGKYELEVYCKAWESSYKKIFRSTDLSNINRIPESIAPYLYYRTLDVGSGLSIDIGGGSSDIAIFENGQKHPTFISSIKFAGNAIFGDRYENSEWSNNSDTNGYVKVYKDKVESAIDSMTTNTKSNIEEIYKSILYDRKNSADFSSLLFSLENESSIDFSYTKLLQGDKFLKLPILIFYSSIIYYSANLCKKQSLKTAPKNIFFSGTASKTLKIIDASKDYKNISKLFKYIFETIMDVHVDRLDIKLDDFPKEITCKGVLKAGIDESIDNCPIVYWLGGSDNTSWDKILDKRKDYNLAPTYNDLSEGTNKEIIQRSIENFFKLIDKYFDTVGNIDNEFSIDYLAYKKFKDIRSSKLQDYLEIGIKSYYNNPNDKIEETLFFYPLIGQLNELATELAYLRNQ